MGIGTVKVTAKNIKKREKIIKRVSIFIIVLVMFLLILFSILSLIYRGGDFIITLDPNFSLKSGLKMYDDPELKHNKIKMYAKGIDFMDNISINWLPNDLDKHRGGSHNGENYIAYTFYIENTGDKEVDYWYELSIIDVIRNVDDAVRIMIIRNEEKTIYAKKNELTNKEEEGTTMFYSNKIPVLEQRKDIKKDETDKITIVIWIEGSDPDCLDNLIGGELKISMRIIESHTKENK
jgi:hypothetical protein